MIYSVIYRISKYDPAFRINGVYPLEEWTDYSCIGKYFFGKRLTHREYAATEHRYLSTLRDVLEYLSIDRMTHSETEWYSTFYRVVKRTPRTDCIKGILTFSKGCLRNKYWAQLLHPDLKIHFSWDYYMELGCDMSKMPKEVMFHIVQKNQLHCQVFVYDIASDTYCETGNI